MGWSEEASVLMECSEMKEAEWRAQQPGEERKALGPTPDPRPGSPT